MITSRRTRLVRVPDLHAFRHAIVGLSLGGDRESLTARAVLIPTAGAERQLRRTLGGEPLPELVTREAFYDRLHARLDNPPPRLTSYERDVIVQSAAREAATTLGLGSAGPGFGGAWRIRLGLIAEILRFYDQLRRQARNVARFRELLDEALSKDAEHDRGAERMLAQTRFLSATFHGYEDRVRASGACDEHVLRERLIAGPSSHPTRDIVVTLGDWIADPSGLYLADFDLLTRLPGVETIDLVATEGLLESGFHQRIREWLPEIEEVDAADLDLGVTTASRPLHVVPAGAKAGRGSVTTDGAPNPDSLVFVHRDREEELIAVARGVKAEGRDPASLDRVAVVFKRPLPYLYLAREVFVSEGVPYQAFDALPLAAEPAAAALDLVFECVESGFTRQSLVALLGSPHFAFEHDARPIDREAVSALDRALSDARYLGGLDRLVELDTAWPWGADEALRLGSGQAAGPALHAARSAAQMLASLLRPAAASTQLRHVIDFLDAYERLIDDDLRLSRARRAVRDALESLATAHATHDDPPIAIAELSASVRRWIEEQTFVPDSGDAGVQFLDDQAARYGEFDDIAVVGLIEGEWPERPKRNIFYPSSLLVSLGWPTEKERRGAAEARFLDLLTSSSRRVTVSTVSLDDEALVEPSAFVDEIPRARLSTVAVDSAMTAEKGSGVDPFLAEAREWAAMRQARSPREAPEYHGFVRASGPGARTVQGDPSPRSWSVSALETYLGCPFKFFAQYVLKLQEEPDDEEIMDPRTEGRFVHEVFEAFFERWQRDGHQTITPDTIDTARTVFGEVVEQFLGRLSGAEASLERTRLLGSPAAAGLGEAVFRMEAERTVPVVARLLEERLKDEFVFETAGGARRVALSGKADRIDLLADGTFRLIDYKLGWPPNRTRALQLPIYGVCAEQRLHGYLGRRWALGEAAYLAFKGPKRVVGLFTSADEREKVLADAQERLVATVDAIAAGHFPPTPDNVHRCETCSYAAVCRKDYVGDV